MLISQRRSTEWTSSFKWIHAANGFNMSYLWMYSTLLFGPWITYSLLIIMTWVPYGNVLIFSHRWEKRAHLRGFNRPNSRHYWVILCFPSNLNMPHLTKLAHESDVWARVWRNVDFRPLSPCEMQLVIHIVLFYSRTTIWCVLIYVNVKGNAQTGGKFANVIDSRVVRSEIVGKWKQ